MKKITTIAILLTLLFLFAIPTSAGDLVPYETAVSSETWTFTDNDTGLSFEMPNEWQVTQPSTLSVYSFYSTDKPYLGLGYYSLDIFYLYAIELGIYTRENFNAENINRHQMAELYGDITSRDVTFTYINGRKYFEIHDTTEESGITGNIKLYVTFHNGWMHVFNLTGIGNIDQVAIWDSILETANFPNVTSDYPTWELETTNSVPVDTEAPETTEKSEHESQKTPAFVDTEAPETTEKSENNSQKTPTTDKKSSNNNSNSSVLLPLIMYMLISIIAPIAIIVLVIVSIVMAGKSSIRRDGSVKPGKTAIDTLTDVGIVIISIILTFIIAFAVGMIIYMITGASFVLGFLPMMGLFFLFKKILSSLYYNRKIRRISKHLKATGQSTLFESIKSFVDPAIIGYCQTYSERGQFATVKQYLKQQFKAKIFTRDIYIILLEEFTK